MQLWTYVLFAKVVFCFFFIHLFTIGCHTQAQTTQTYNRLVSFIANWSCSYWPVRIFARIWWLLSWASFFACFLKTFNSNIVCIFKNLYSLSLLFNHLLLSKLFIDGIWLLIALLRRIVAIFFAITSFLCSFTFFDYYCETSIIFSDLNWLLACLFLSLFLPSIFLHVK